MDIEQERYQVRFDRSVDGAFAVATDADVLIWVDARTTDDPPLRHLPAVPAMLRTDLPCAMATADWVFAEQLRLGKRLVIAVIAACADRNGLPRPVVEDDLAAGAVISRLVDRGLDATSPEAAFVEAAFRGLSRATSHLFSASVTASTSRERNSRDRVDVDRGPGDVRVIRQG